MNNALIIGIAVVIFAVIIGGFVARARAAKKTKELAAARGWRYEKSDVGILDSYPQLFPFYSETGGRGKPGLSFGDTSHGEARDVLYFNAGDFPANSFTYTYTTHEQNSDNETSTTKNYWHVVGLDLPTPFPSLIIRRRRKLDALENRLTKPVEFPQADLNAAYTIHSEHPPAALDIVTPQMAAWLVHEEFRNEMVLQDQKLYVFSKGRQKIDNIDPMLKQLTDFLAHIPAETWQKTQGEYPRPERIKHVQSLDLGQMKAAYDEWRDSQ